MTESGVWWLLAVVVDVGEHFYERAASERRPDLRTTLATRHARCSEIDAKASFKEFLKQPISRPTNKHRFDW